MSYLRVIAFLLIALLLLVGCTDEQAVENPDANVVGMKQTQASEPTEEVVEEPAEPELRENVSEEKEEEEKSEAEETEAETTTNEERVNEEANADA